MRRLFFHMTIEPLFIAKEYNENITFEEIRRHLVKEYEIKSYELQFYFRSKKIKPTKKIREVDSNRTINISVFTPMKKKMTQEQIQEEEKTKLMKMGFSEISSSTLLLVSRGKTSILPSVAVGRAVKVLVDREEKEPDVPSDYEEAEECRNQYSTLRETIMKRGPTKFYETVEMLEANDKEFGDLIRKEPERFLTLIGLDPDIFDCDRVFRAPPEFSFLVPTLRKSIRNILLSGQSNALSLVLGALEENGDEYHAPVKNNLEGFIKCLGLNPEDFDFREVRT